jgi:hypothetical protein
VRPGYPAPLHRPQSLPLAQAPLPDLFPSSSLQEIEKNIDGRSPLPPYAAPVILFSFFWKQSSPPSSPSGLPRRGGHRRVLSVVKGSPETRRSSAPVRLAGGPRRKPRWALLWIFPTVRSSSYAPDQVTYRTGMGRSGASRSNKIQRSTLCIRPNRYAPTRTRHVSHPDLIRFKLEFLNQI